MRIDRAVREIGASVEEVFRALTDRSAVQAWLPPEGAHGVIDAFEPKPGGSFRMTLVFESSGGGKTTETTDVVIGEFVEVVPDQLVRQRFTFDSDDPLFSGTMTMSWSLTPTATGTRVSVTAEDVPVGISPEDHEAGMQSSLANLAGYLQQQPD